jgi:SAM-dependent methyltransferase
VFALISSDPPPAEVRRVTFVPFLPDGRCVLIEDGGPRLPTGEVRPGEDYLLDAVLRVPLETAGFRYQRVRPFGVDGSHLYAWIEGGPYHGARRHVRAELSYQPAQVAAGRLRAAGEPVLADAVLAAEASYRTQGEQEFYADALRTLERGYLRGATPQAGSGFGGDELAWRRARHHITEAITGDGSFLDVGCANGLLMESVVAWCAEDGHVIEPYGIDLAPRLVELAQDRLPRWADRIWAGNAISWRPPGGLRFDYVHVLLDTVPDRRRADLIRHHLAHTVRAGPGRLLVSHYTADPAAGVPSAAEILRSLGFRPLGETSGDRRPGRPLAPAAWL